MFWQIVKSIGYFIAAPAIALLIRQLVIYLKLNKYRSQGIRCYYVPILGIRKALPGGVILSDLRKKVEEKVQGEQIVAGNSLISLEPNLYITGTRLFRQFLDVENKYFKRTALSEKVHPNKSFIFENGAKGMKFRSIFTGFFRAENIKKIIPKIEAVFEESFKNLAVKLFEDKVELDSEGQLRLREGVEAEDLEWQKVDFKPFLSEPFDRMINLVLFGSKSEEDSPQFDGDKLFSEAVREFVLLKFSSFATLPNILSGGLFDDMKLSPASRKVFVEKNKFFKIMKAFFDERKNSGKYDGVNLLDMMIRHNQKCLEEGNIEDFLDDERIVDNMRSFYFAGYDTSKANSGFGLFNLSYYPKMREKFVKDVEMLNRQDPETRDYDCAQYITKFFRENLRLLGPALSTFPRYCAKTCKIGDYVVYKGSLVTVRIDLFNTNPDVYEDPFEFNPERFADKKILDKATRQLSNVPFSPGRRSCMGQYLGEMLIKIVLRTALTCFEFQWDGESERGIGIGAVMEPLHIKVAIKPMIATP